VCSTRLQRRASADWNSALTATHSGRAPRLEAWNGKVANIRAIAELARDRYGVRAVIRPHPGGYIEFEDELDRVAQDVPGEVAGLCRDSGHIDHSGTDPIATLRRCAPRTEYIHFKDIDDAKYTDVMGRHIRFFDALR
jgi:inosose dehydratase